MANSQVRVIRLIEITYPDHATYEGDRQHWAIQDGSRRFGSNTYKQSTLLASTVGDEPDAEA